MHKLSERNVSIENLFFARFLQKVHFLQDSKNTTLAKFLQEMRKCCKMLAKILQDLLSNSAILQDMYFLQEFCKCCIDCKTFAQNCLSCEVEQSEWIHLRIGVRHGTAVCLPRIPRAFERVPTPRAIQCFFTWTYSKQHCSLKF